MELFQKTFHILMFHILTYHLLVLFADVYLRRSFFLAEK